MTSRGQNDEISTIPKLSGESRPHKGLKSAMDNGLDGDMRERRRDGKRYQHDELTKQHHPDRDRDRVRQRDLALKASSTPKVSNPRDNSESKVDPLFVIDRRGDPLIMRYGSNERSSIPHYRRAGKGRILGAHGFISIQRDGPNQVFSLRGYGEGPSVLRDRHLFRLKMSKARQRPVRIRKDDHIKPGEAAEMGEYVPMRPTKRRKQDPEDSESSTEDKPSYRSIEGKAKPHEHSDSDIDYGSDLSQDEVAMFRDDPLRQKSIDLSRRIKEHPEDIDAWFELIRHQDALMTAGKDADREVTKSEAKSYAEIKLSMFESALSHARSRHDRERLLLGMMREGSRIWSTKTIEKRWEEIAKEHDMSFSLWKAHLEFEFATTGSGYSRLRNLHRDRIQYLAKSMLTDRLSSTKDLDSPYHELIYVFLRATGFIRDAGYTELAVAAWQALLELNFNRPPKYHGPPALERFQDFWESEAARIGEDNAKGWAAYDQNDGLTDSPKPRSDGHDAVPESRDVYKLWAATEQLRAMKSWQPARTMDEIMEDDPFRVVMYSDFSDLLFVVPQSILGDVREHLIDAFLIFCHFPAAFGANAWSEMASVDPFLTQLGNSFLVDVSESDQGGIEIGDDGHRKPPKFSADGLQAAVSPELLFPGPQWFHYLENQSAVIESPDRVVRSSLVLNTVRHLVRQAGFGKLASYCLALERLNIPASIKKAAKAMIKEYPRSVELYSTYAIAEYANQNWEVARKVVAAATELPSAGSSAFDSSLILWRTWAWMELEEGQKASAAMRLCAAIDSSLKGVTQTIQVTSAQILKAKQQFLTSQDYLLSTRDYHGSALNAECLALLEYLTAEGGSEPQSTLQGNVSAAMASIWRCSGDFCSRGRAKDPAHERLLQFAARLLYLHSTMGPFRRAFLREQLSSCIELFPRNTIFLTLFAWADTSLRIEDHVRELLRRVVLIDANDCVSNRVFAISHELEKGNVHSARAAFEHAMESDACKSSAWLWICYIRFCYRREEFRVKAKEVFYRAVRNCPWSKDLAMEAFITLARDMDSSELRDVFNAIVSKGLRTHMDLDEFIENWKASRRG